MNIPIVTDIFGFIIKLIYDISHNYMLALVLFAIIVKLCLFPFGVKQQKNTIKQAKLRPMETAIRRKYAGRNDQKTQQAMQQEIMELYQSEGYNPASGCLPLLIQMPILFGLYHVVVNPLKFVSGIGSDVVSKLTNMLGASNYDINIMKSITDMGASLKPAVDSVLGKGDVEKITQVRESFFIFGESIDLSVNPVIGLSWSVLIPILTFVFAFGSTKIIRKFTYQPVQVQQTQKSMSMMDWAMPLLSVWISVSVPAAIGIYWMIQNILSAVQQIVLYKMFPVPEITEEQIKEAELQLKGKANKKKQNEQKSNSNLPEPDENSPIYEEVPDVDFDELDSKCEVNSRPTGLTPAIKKHLKETGKPLKARRRI